MKKMTFKDYITEDKFKTGDKLKIEDSFGQVYRLRLKEKKGKNWEVEILSTSPSKEKRTFSIDFIESHGEK